MPVQKVLVPDSLSYISMDRGSDHEPDPGRTDCRKYIGYVTFDLSDYLNEGFNAIGAEVSNGRYIMDDHHCIPLSGIHAAESQSLSRLQ